MQVDLLPIFQNNYIFVIHDETKAVVVDPGESEYVLEFLEEKKLKLEGILITHHHPDHIGGLATLKEKFQVPIYAPLLNREQIPWADHFVQDYDHLRLMDLDLEVLALPGHTLGHVAFWIAKKKWLFSGDVIFGLSCGRLFEGTAEQAFQSFAKLKQLPLDTTIFCTHEYTETNLRFCQSLSVLESRIPQEELKKYAMELKAKRDKGLPSVPLKLEIEMKTNPFLIAKTPEQFGHLRALRNQFS